MADRWEKSRPTTPTNNLRSPVAGVHREPGPLFSLCAAPKRERKNDGT